MPEHFQFSTWRTGYFAPRGGRVNRLAEFPEICLKHFTSRFLCPWNPHTHDYLSTYMEVLDMRPISKILEVGLGTAGFFHPQQLAGCGLRMWAETFPEAEIFGLDINPDALVNEGRIKSFQCDQSNADQLDFVAKLIGDEIDFIVDDASHKPHDQVLTAEIFVPLMSDTGVYVIEDVLHKDECCTGLDAAGFRYRVVELRTNVLPDDRLVIIEAKDNRHD